MVVTCDQLAQNKILIVIITVLEMIVLLLEH